MFKKIELYGFKSFADRIIVNFSGGLTCIVGPNGCGKSNVSDAIRWVLGEQSSKALRGTNMQDVIFKGTEARKQLGYCEVNLYFDNTSKMFPVDFDEVVIGRKLYRSGESEYLLNRNPVRLKDINTLLHDSGIDRDGMTIIGQGQVAEIINAKAEGRRGILEEAAGISNFKSRKVEAERKLERVAAELVRVNDVISEIDRTLGPLLRQAEKAEIYVHLRDQLKLLEINAYLHSYDTQADKKTQLQSVMDKTTAELSEKQALIADLQSTGARAMSDLNSLDERAENLRELILELSLTLQRTEGEGTLAAEKVAFLQGQERELIKELSALETRLEFDQSNLENAKKLLSSLNLESARLTEKLSAASARWENARATTSRLFDLRHKREKLLGRRETIAAMDGGEGFKFAVKKLLSSNEPRITQNMIGVVAKLLTPNKDLELAIETALGSSAQNIVVPTEDNAKTLIELLKQNNWGRATFLPLSAMKGRTITPEERRNFTSSVLGVASELVTFDRKIEPAITSLLGRVVITDTINTAVALAKTTRYAFKIVTLSGDVIEPRGSITGGSKNSLQGQLWHTTALEEIDKELTTVDAELAKLDSADEAGLSDDLTALKVKLAATSSEIAHLTQTIETGINTARELYATFRAKSEQLKSIQSTLLVAQGREIDQEGAKLYREGTQKLESAKVELAKIDQHKEELRALAFESDERRTQTMDEAASLHELYYKTQAALEKLDNDINALQERIWEEYGLNYSSCYPFKVENFDYQAALSDISALRKEISKLGHINIEAIEQSKDAKTRFDSYTTQVADLNAAKADLEQIIANLCGEMTEKFRQTFDAVNQNFGVVFRELFGGGSARMFLTDPDDILNSGIEIEAVPNGKRLQNINLLSGGEKALTSIAILFAILKLRPMPFCLLDEIEAALDEANVTRFANYLKRYSTTAVETPDNCALSSTQFIVITHRKPTMELADHLYGVTMEEKGVSKLVSVKLEAYA